MAHEKSRSRIDACVECAERRVHCKRRAEACRRCADECRQMAA
ncbi:MAG TPA: hypothetical protein VKP69_11580 [Isosphaeraceae bacterium]|nr:hypothetical protein [Isosphaeraceae bacterium]